MLEYIYFVKCPNCEDEHFYFFNDAKDFAMGCLSQKPIITQVEVNRNDFGECTDSCDLGTVWSWEDMMANDEPAKCVFTADDLKGGGYDPEFDDLDNSLEPVIRKPVPAGMTIESLVEEMEENEDTVECKWCDELFDKSECRYEVDLGWLCSRCQQAIASRGEALTFRDGFLDEDLDTTAISKAIEDVLNKAVDQVDDEHKLQILLTLSEFTTPEKLDEVFKLIKGFVGADPVLTDEDKDVIARKLNIDRALLDPANTILSAIAFIYKKAPVAAGVILDVLEISPVDELIAGIPSGGWGAVVTAILSCIPDKALIGALMSIRNFITDKVFNTIKNIIINKVLPEPETEALTEASKYKNSVELHYDSLTAEITTEVIPATYWDPADYIEGEYTDEFDFEVDIDTVAEALWNEFISEEDVADVPGGLAALEDEATWRAYLDTHLDILLEKYNDKLLEYFREDAEEAASEVFQERYNELHNEGPDPDRAYDEWRDENRFSEGVQTSFLETLEEPDDYRKHLVMCPECGDSSFDTETGICVACGFN